MLLLLIACGNECNYFEACDGDTLLVCGDSVDQQFGRKIHEQPCDAPNPTCVTMTDKYATCAVDDTDCAEGDPAACDGDVLLVCTHVLQTYDVDGSPADDVWLTVGTDCAADGKTCDAASGACVASR